MFIKVLVLKLVEAMMLDSGVGGEIGIGDGAKVELKVVTDVSFGCDSSAHKVAKDVKGGGHLGVGGSVDVCVGRGVETSPILCNLWSLCDIIFKLDGGSDIGEYYKSFMV